jgi:uncharacterized membrane protein
VATDVVFIVMAQEHTAGDRARATESRLSLLTDVTTAFNARRLRGLRRTLFGQYAGRPA